MHANLSWRNNTQTYNLYTCMYIYIYIYIYMTCCYIYMYNAGYSLKSMCTCTCTPYIYMYSMYIHFHVYTTNITHYLLVRYCIYSCTSVQLFTEKAHILLLYKPAFKLTCNNCMYMYTAKILWKSTKRHQN